MVDSLPIDANRYTIDRLALIDWLATPPSIRKPRTQYQLAALLNRDAGTLSDWKKTPGFLEELARRRREYVKSEDVTAVIAAQVRRAKRGDAAAARLILEYAGELPDKAAGDGAGAGAMAHASAVAVTVLVDGRQVDEENARRAAARQLLDVHTLPPEAP